MALIDRPSQKVRCRHCGAVFASDDPHPPAFCAAWKTGRRLIEPAPDDAPIGVPIAARIGRADPAGR